MSMLFKIHPAIGIARVGDSPDGFCIGPDGTGELPIACDAQGQPLRTPDGREQRIEAFKDSQRRILRQAARFRIHVHAPDGSEHELRLGESIEAIDTPSGRRVKGRVVDVHWRVYLANKKSSFYEFRQLDGEHGYAASHPLRNAGVIGDEARRRLIIDPGPCRVQSVPPQSQRAAFARREISALPQSFPPPLQPCSIDTLGDLIAGVTDERPRLLVLGGHGRSGSMLGGLGEPKISTYANNDGWFDDTSDGPVSAQLEIELQQVNGRATAPGDATSLLLPVQGSAWVIVGYPRYAPQITDMVTMDDTIFDTAVRNQAFRPEIFGLPPFDRLGTENRASGDAALAAWRRSAQWNPDYHPWFWRDIWPVLQRPDRYKWVMDFDPFTGGDPHNPTPGAGGVFDPQKLSLPPTAQQDADTREALRQRRQAIYRTLRQPGQENDYTLVQNRLRPGIGPVGMPDLCGDNPISNSVPSKFLRLSETTLFLLGQWAEGKFVDERAEHFESMPAQAGTGTGAAPQPEPTGEALDRGVLGNVLGGAFCPGAETGWILRNPAIYAEPYRIRVSPNATTGSLSLLPNLSAGMEPGDITRYSSVPWQSDFNECSNQDIDVTYRNWNSIDPAGNGDPAQPVVQPVYWWPAHRPMEVFLATPAAAPVSTAGSQVMTSGTQVPWTRGIPQSKAGDLMMVSAWRLLGFVRDNPGGGPNAPAFVEVEGDLPSA